MNNGFYTLKGYQINENPGLTAAMEDYLEMICRILNKKEAVKVGVISEMLHVRPSSVSKMIQQLTTLGYINSEKYGIISLTEKGKSLGDYLLYRHDVINKFLCCLNNSDDELEQAEKIEHFLDRKTIENLDKLTKKLKDKK